MSGKEFTVEFDIVRLKEAIGFLKDGEKFVISFENITVTLYQGKSWLNVGMEDQLSLYRHGINLDKPMQSKGNVEYWIFKVYKHMMEREGVGQ